MSWRPGWSERNSDRAVGVGRYQCRLRRRWSGEVWESVTARTLYSMLNVGSQHAETYLVWVNSICPMGINSSK